MKKKTGKEKIYIQKTGQEREEKVFPNNE